MKAMILAAGRGKRMRPLTDDVPKPLLKAGEKSLIEYRIEALRKSGIIELVINTGWLGERLKAALGNGSRYGVNIEYSTEPQTAYETGGGIYYALPLLSDPFIVVNGDLWTDYDFSLLSAQPRVLAHLVMVDNPSPDARGDFSIERGYARPRGANLMTFSGIGCYRKALFAGQRAGSYPLAPILREFMLQDRVTAEHYAGVWQDVGTPARLSGLNRRLKRRGNFELAE